MKTDSLWRFRVPILCSFFFLTEPIPEWRWVMLTHSNGGQWLPKSHSGSSQETDKSAEIQIIEEIQKVTGATVHNCTPAFFAGKLWDD